MSKYNPLLSEHVNSLKSTMSIKRARTAASTSENKLDWVVACGGAFPCVVEFLGELALDVANLASTCRMLRQAVCATYCCHCGRIDPHRLVRMSEEDEKIAVAATLAASAASNAGGGVVVDTNTDPPVTSSSSSSSSSVLDAAASVAAVGVSRYQHGSRNRRACKWPQGLDPFRHLYAHIPWWMTASPEPTLLAAGGWAAFLHFDEHRRYIHPWRKDGPVLGRDLDLWFFNGAELENWYYNLRGSLPRSLEGTDGARIVIKERVVGPSKWNTKQKFYPLPPDASARLIVQVQDSKLQPIGPRVKIDLIARTHNLGSAVDVLDTFDLGCCRVGFFGDPHSKEELTRLPPKSSSNHTSMVRSGCTGCRWIGTPSHGMTLPPRPDVTTLAQARQYVIDHSARAEAEAKEKERKRNAKDPYEEDYDESMSSFREKQFIEARSIVRIEKYYTRGYHTNACRCHPDRMDVAALSSRMFQCVGFPKSVTISELVARFVGACEVAPAAAAAAATTATAAH